jgi:hypothetical protein
LSDLRSLILTSTFGTANTLTQFSKKSDYAKRVKKAPFDGTKRIYLWTTQLIGSATTYNCKQAILGIVTIPKATDVLDESQDADKKLLLTRKINDTAKRLFNISLTDKVSQMALYNGITTELPNGDAANVWKIMFKLFPAKNINKINELMSEFVKRTLFSDSTNPDEWFAELYFIRRRHEEYYRCTTFGDVEMLNQIIYNTKPADYQMQ